MKLIGKVERAGYALIPLNLHYKGGRIKLEIGLAKGKKQHDKRNDEQEKDWQREKEQIMKDVRKMVRAEIAEALHPTVEAGMSRAARQA
jgi:SsrA-binding protein